MNVKTSFAIIAIAALVFSVAFSSVLVVNEASAKIRCQNPGGQEPQGNCQGQALQRVNPAGHAPPGQNQ
jgi:hypothetical protein